MSCNIPEPYCIYNAGLGFSTRLEVGKPRGFRPLLFLYGSCFVGADLVYWRIITIIRL